MSALAGRPRRVIVLGAAGRDFHDFNVYWRPREDCRVVAFTAAQIPDIAGRTYPAELAGPRYPEGLPIHPEARLAELIAEHDVDTVAMAYSDLPHEQVMHKASVAAAAGADFVLLAPRHTMLTSSLPVIAVCAVRTGCGKSQTTRHLAGILKAMGRRVAVVRHPMPYGDLRRQVCQRFAALDDLDRHDCTIEEREEYEPHIAAGNLCFAGVDYEQILRAAEREADVILWDGGNNDTPFFVPDLHVVLVDPQRPDHGERYHPGETNLRMADVVLVNKLDTATAEDRQRVLASVARTNPRAAVVLAESPVTVDGSPDLRGRRVLVVEDGPTVTHGEMGWGAGAVAARQLGARLVDPRPAAVGSIREVYRSYPHLHDVLPAMGYGARQVRELEQTIRAIDCDAVLVGTPIDLGRLLDIDKPAHRVRYSLRELTPGQLEAAVRAALARG